MRRMSSFARKSYFTLIELLVGMGVLSLIMVLLFQFVLTTERTWNLSESTARIYENSRAVFDLLERDLHAIVTSAVADQQIKLYIGTPDPAVESNSIHCCVVSSIEPEEQAKSRLCEISYYHHTDSGSPASRWILKRQVVSDYDSNNWDCFNPGIGWYNNNNTGANAATFEKVIGGVAEFTMQFYDSDGNLMGGGSTTDMPNQVVVNLVLFDENLVDAPEEERFKTKRAFSKIFYLSHLQQPGS